MGSEKQALTAKLLRDKFNQSVYDRQDPRKVQELGMNELANREHYNFTRSLVYEKPWMFPSVLVATPGYYAAKKLGILPEEDSTSEATLDQVKSGLRGAWDGLTR